MSVAPKYLYGYALALSVGSILLLLAHISMLHKSAKEDASIILTQEAHITKLRSLLSQGSPTTKTGVIILRENETTSEYSSGLSESIEQHRAEGPVFTRLSIVAKGQ